jgi:hypothetical protein
MPDTGNPVSKNTILTLMWALIALSECFGVTLALGPTVSASVSTLGWPDVEAGLERGGLRGCTRSWHRHPAVRFGLSIARLADDNGTIVGMALSALRRVIILLISPSKGRASK